VALFETDRVLALDIGAGKVVLAEFRADRQGGLELLNYGVDSLGGGHESETDRLAYIATAIRSLMRDHGFKPAPLYMSISGQAVFPRFVKLPPVARDKIGQLVQYEAEQNVPFPIEEVVWDYQLLGEIEGGEQNAMLVAAKSDNIKRLTDAVAAAELEPDVIDVAPMALYNAVRYNYADAEGCTMLLDIGSRSTNLVFIEGDHVFSRSIPVAGHAITQEIMKGLEISFEEAEALKCSSAFVAFGGVYGGLDDERIERMSKIVRNVLTRLHAEVNRSINFYRGKQGGQAPVRLLLTGGSSVIPHVDTFFAEKLKLEVEAFNPFRNVSVAESVSVDRVGGDIQLLGEVVGLGLRRALTCPVEINLISSDLRAAKQLRRRQPFFILAAVGLALVMLCWWVFFHRMGTVINSTTVDVKGRIARLEQSSDDLSRVMVAKERAEGRVSRLSAVVLSRSRWLGLVDSIYAQLFDGMWVMGIRPTTKNGREAIDVDIHGFVDKLAGIEAGGSSGVTPAERVLSRLKEAAQFTKESEIITFRIGDGGNEDYVSSAVFRLYLADRSSQEEKP
jgi:type IV pilus assembly protein PilM